MSEEIIELQSWTQFLDYYEDHEYDENFFSIFPEMKQYIEETGKLPCRKGDKRASKHYQDWYNKWKLKEEEKWLKRKEKEKSQLSYWIKNEKTPNGEIVLLIPPNLKENKKGKAIQLTNENIKRINKEINN